MRILLTSCALLLSSSAMAMPDLRFDNVDGVFDPILDEVAFSITIKNNGTATSGSAYLDVYTDPDNGGWDDCDGNHYFQAFSGLTTGAITTLTFTLSGDEAQGPVYFFLDLDGFVNEANEDNNEGVTFFLPLGHPHLAKSNIVHDNPECLEDLILGSFGAVIGDAPIMFYSKLRIL